MPRAWTDNVERMYEHIQESGEQRGIPEDRDVVIAARTVNERRRLEGRTPNRRTQGTGNPNLPLEALADVAAAERLCPGRVNAGAEPDGPLRPSGVYCRTWQSSTRC